VRRWLPIHPVAMTTMFRRCFLVNFDVDPAAMRARLPVHLEPDLHAGRAFLSIVIADMVRMRPGALPPVFGITYTQVVYRAVVKCAGERGVTFLRSDTDNRLMAAAGNALTFFHFNLASVSWELTDRAVAFSLEPRAGDRARISAKFDIGGNVSMPVSSKFANIADAAVFLTELYAAFGQRRRDGRVEVVRIARSPWSSRPVTDSVGIYEAMTAGALFRQDEAQLDSIFHVEDLTYYWHPLSLELKE
jgi:uncharacterized protein YqjF (DUF2071 family)